MSFGQRKPKREEIFTALFGLLNNVSWNVGTNAAPDIRGFKEKTRIIRLFSDVSPALQPWIGQAEHSETVEQITNTPYKRKFKASWMVYHRAADTPNLPGAIWTNLILDALEAALAPVPQDEGFFDDRNTLQGLVWHCFIDGEVFKDPGDIDKQALVIVPITLLVP